MGLVNAWCRTTSSTPRSQRWCAEICERSPTAIAIAKRASTRTPNRSAAFGMGMYALRLYYETEESREGVNAFQEKRKPEFR